MYKQSVYNIKIKNTDDGNELYYNSFTGAVCLFDKCSQDVLKDVDKDDVSEYGQDKKERLDQLVENGFVIIKDFDEFNWLTIRNRGLRYNIDSDRLRLTIAPTMRCNYKCYYCYENRAEKCPEMNEDVIQDLIAYVRDKIENGNLSVLNISWYGGEPLLKIDLVKRISKELINLCEGNGVLYHADILTNGYLLNRENAILLKEECRVDAAQIPMDGMMETYCKRKGVDSKIFEQVVANILEVSDIMELHVRMNIDKENEQEIYHLTKYLLIEKKLKEKIRVYLAAVKNYTNVCNFMGEACFTSEDFFECHNKFYKYLYELGVENSIMKAIPAPRWISCGLSQVNGVIVDPEGYLYRCAHLIGHKDHIIGHLKTGHFYNDEDMKFLDVEYAEKCKKCNLFPICMGGCVFERMLNSDEPVCRETIGRLKNDIALAYNILEGNQ